MEILVAVIFSGLITFLLIPFILKFSKRFNIYVNHKKNFNKNKVVRIGGIAIGISSLFTFLIVSYFYSDFSNTSIIIRLCIGSLFFLILGLVDDLLELDALKRLIIEFALTLSLISPDLIIGGFNFSLFDYQYTIFIPKLIGYIFSALWIVGFTNALNWIDGIDGLATGITLILSVQILIPSIILNDLNTTILLASLFGSCIIFLYFNRFPSKIIMGDSGSYFIGFLLSSISILVFSNLNQYNSEDLFIGSKNIMLLNFSFALIMLPVFDMLFVVISRIKNNLPIIYGDRRHLHYRLIDLGYSEKQTAYIICIVYIFISAISIINIARTISFIYFLIILPLFIIRFKTLSKYINS